jgi:hypothetical protein
MLSEYGKCRILNKECRMSKKRHKLRFSNYDLKIQEAGSPPEADLPRARQEARKSIKRKTVFLLPSVAV